MHPKKFFFYRDAWKGSIYESPYNKFVLNSKWHSYFNIASEAFQVKLIIDCSVILWKGYATTKSKER